MPYGDPTAIADPHEPRRAPAASQGRDDERPVAGDDAERPGAGDDPTRPVTGDDAEHPVADPAAADERPVTGDDPTLPVPGPAAADERPGAGDDAERPVADPAAADERPVVLDRTLGVTGELVLRRHGAAHELLIDGAFAMSSHIGGTSERTQVDATLAAASGEPQRLLLGGLGLGLSLAHAVGVGSLRSIVVVEVEPKVVDWHRTLLRETTDDALADGRVSVTVGDVADVLADADVEPFDAIALDVDNGPDWLLRQANARLYEPAFLDRAAARLRPGGAFSVWGSRQAPGLVAALAGRFARVEEIEIPVPRGEPDWLCVAAGPLHR